MSFKITPFIYELKITPLITSTITVNNAKNSNSLLSVSNYVLISVRHSVIINIRKYPFIGDGDHLKLSLDSLIYSEVIKG